METVFALKLFLFVKGAIFMLICNDQNGTSEIYMIHPRSKGRHHDPNDPKLDTGCIIDLSLIKGETLWQ
jgi:hypothetical protein